MMASVIVGSSPLSELVLAPPPKMGPVAMLPRRYMVCTSAMPGCRDLPKVAQAHLSVNRLSATKAKQSLDDMAREAVLRKESVSESAYIHCQHRIPYFNETQG